MSLNIFIRYWTPLVVFLMGVILMVAYHEEAHVQINRAYDIDSRIDWFSNFPRAVSTISNEPCPTESCKLAHNLNEVIGYTLFSFYIAIGGLFLLTRAVDFKIDG
jgi:hypothetical protein